MAVTRAEQPGLSRFVLPIAGLIALGLCVAGILVLIDKDGGPNLLASIYDAIGNTTGATDLRNGTGDQLLAKFLLAIIALAVGVGGIDRLPRCLPVSRPQVEPALEHLQHPCQRHRLLGEVALRPGGIPQQRLAHARQADERRQWRELVPVVQPGAALQGGDEAPPGVAPQAGFTPTKRNSRGPTDGSGCCLLLNGHRNPPYYDLQFTI